MFVLVALLCGAIPLPERLYYPAIEPSPLTFRWSGRDPRTGTYRLSIDGVPTDIERHALRGPQPTAHRVDRDRDLILPGLGAQPIIWNRRTRTLQPLQGMMVFAVPGFGQVLIEQTPSTYRVMDLGGGGPMPRPLFESPLLLVPIGHDGPRLLLGSESQIVLLEGGHPPRVMDVELGGFHIVSGADAVRGDKVLLVRYPMGTTPQLSLDCPETPPYSADVAIYDLRTKKVRPAGKTRGYWYAQIMNMQTCPRPTVDVRWVSLARLDAASGTGLVVEEWDEVVARPPDPAESLGMLFLPLAHH